MTRATQAVFDVSALIELIGTKRWAARMGELAREAACGQRLGRAMAQRHVIEAMLERFRRAAPAKPTSVDRAVATFATDVMRVWGTLSGTGRLGLRAALGRGLTGAGTFAEVFHLLRTARLQRARGFDVRFAGWEDGTPFDLLLSRDGAEAEIACDTVSAEDGRDLSRGAWVRLVDRIDPDLQTWLASHPGRYLLKITLPQGLREQDPCLVDGEGATRPDALAVLHERIRGMLARSQRADQDEAVVLRLDPLMLAAAQADELGLLPSLRREFGHEAHLAVTTAGNGVFVMAARAGRQDEVASAVRRRLAVLAPTRLTGTRPGILALLIEDTDRAEWRFLRDRLVLEGEARQFLTTPEARGVVAVTCASRLELLDDDAASDLADGELRFRNPGHPAAKTAALSAAVASTI